MISMKKRLSCFFAIALAAQLVCALPGFAVGSSHVEGTPFLLAASGGSGNSAANAAAPVARNVTLDVGLYPTREGNSQVFFTWNSSPSSANIRLYRAILYFTTTNPYGRIKFNSPWMIDDDNLFSDTISYDYKYELNVNEIPDGECYRQDFDHAGYYVIGAIVYNLDGVWCGDYYYPYAQTTNNYITDNAPSFAYCNGTLTIGKVCEGRRVLEFRRVDTPYGGSSGITDESTLNEMLFTSLIDTEADNPMTGYYNLGSNPVLYRWRPGRHSVGVNFRSTVNQSVFSDAIDSAIAQVNAVMSEFGVSFYRSGTIGEVSITVDTERGLFPDAVAKGYYYGGTWNTWVSGGNIVGATIKYACDFRDYAAYNSYEHVVFEEFLQSMGAGYDQLLSYDDTVHVDFNYYNKPAYLTDRDADILRLVYSDAIRAGDSYKDVSRKLNIPMGCYMPSTSTKNAALSVSCKSFLDAGASYQVRAFVVNAAGKVSGTSEWLTIQT